ncbi:MAG: hypothetical protein IH946_04520, partial [Bacteroidetes bacterium]|nr:hypothetical protein [Bacteroidota bacterium]
MPDVSYNEPLFQRAIGEFFDDDKKRDKFMEGMAKSGVYKKPPDFHHTFLFPHIKLMWNPGTDSYVSLGSLGLGNIGAEASMPVMEGKCVLFKELADIDAFPICVKNQNDDEIINLVKNIAPVFGGINLEDIKAPRCFKIEEELLNIGIPV